MKKGTMETLPGRKITLLLTCMLLLLANVGISKTSEITGKLSEKMQSGDDVTLSWESATGLRVLIEDPLLLATIGGKKQVVPVTLTSHSVKDGKATFDYDISLSAYNNKTEGKYHVECMLPSDGKGELLIYKTQFEFAKPVRLDVTIEQRFLTYGQQAKSVIIPERRGIVRTHKFIQAPQSYFDIGLAVNRDDTQLAMPAIGVDFATDSLAFAADPYVGTAFIPASISKNGKDYAQVLLSTRYSGSRVPVLSEERTISLQFHRDEINGTLNNFYHTIPDIKPGPAWIHDIQLTFYEYISETGESFKPDLDTLAARIPEEFRKNVLVCVHGYYDYLGRYAYNHETKTFDDEWDAYDDNKQRLHMTKEELHRRIRLVKSYGFRVGIYYADAFAYDGLNPDLRKDWLLMDENGDPARWWYWQKRPDKHDNEENYMMDPSNPEVQQWFADYTKAYIKEFGKELDTLVWDETHCVLEGQLAKTPRGMVHLDREVMKLVAEVAREVQSAWDINPNLALLLSDNIEMHGAKHIPFCLVSHGTWQDSFCNPKAWAPGLIPNYRNCLYSCNWYPVRNRSFNRLAVEDYGLPQGMTNGWGDNMGPSEMPKVVLDEIIDSFLRRCKSGKDRTRYLLPRPSFWAEESDK